MKTAGIIAEYNPFHNGHKYLIEETRRTTGADHIIVVMSGDFIQRGGPAMADKYARTSMALQNGADLVLELPVCYAAASAEYFSSGAIALLDKLGIIDFLCFGSECGNTSLLQKTAARLTHESPHYQSLLQKNLKDGLSYPAARTKSLQDSTDDPSCVSSALLESPNNILGIEYCRSLQLRNSNIIPYTILRKGAGYHDVQLPDQSLGSATAIRNCLENGGRTSEIESYVPANILPLLPQSPRGPIVVRADDFSQLLHYKLLMDAPAGYHRYLDISEDLSDKIRKHLPAYSGYMNFCETLKSKDLTFSRISRSLLHILLDIGQADMNTYKEADYILYGRMLGFRKDAAGLLHAIKEHSSIPLLSKLADASALLSETGRLMLNHDIQASHIYNIIYAEKCRTTLPNEYTRQLVRM